MSLSYNLKSLDRPPTGTQNLIAFDLIQNIHKDTYNSGSHWRPLLGKPRARGLIHSPPKDGVSLPSALEIRLSTIEAAPTTGTIPNMNPILRPERWNTLIGLALVT